MILCNCAFLYRKCHNEVKMFLYVIVFNFWLLRKWLSSILPILVVIQTTFK